MFTCLYYPCVHSQEIAVQGPGTLIVLMQVFIDWLTITFAFWMAA